MLVVMDQLLNNLAFTGHLLIGRRRIPDDRHIAVQIAKQAKVALVKQEIGPVAIGRASVHDGKIRIKAAYGAVHPVHIVRRHGQAVHHLINVRDVVHHSEEFIGCFPRIVKASSRFDLIGGLLNSPNFQSYR